MKKLSALCITSLFCTSLVAQNCSPATAYDYLDLNNVKARINNGGDLWWNHEVQADGEYLVPKSANVSSFFSGALWIGGLDQQGNLHVAAQTYRQNGNDFFPGPLDASGNVTAQACTNFDRIWKVNKSTVDSFHAGLFVSTPASILEWPGRNNPHLSFLPDQDLAPFIDVNGDQVYDAAQGDYPAIPGDQALWFVFNDNGNVHGETGGVPLGIEVRCFAYVLNDAGACTYSTTFYHYSIINKSANDYDSVFVGLWADPSLGCNTDDRIGSDSIHNLGIVYNGDTLEVPCAVDFGNEPRTLAIQVLKGPANENGDPHGLDHFMYYEAGANPESAKHYYQYLQSIFKDGTHLANPNTGSTANYAYPGDPTDASGWSMCTENVQKDDLRLIVSSGPFQMQAGVTQTLDVAVIYENEDAFPCPSSQNILALSDCVKDHFLNDVVFTGGVTGTSLSAQITVFPNPADISSDIHFSGKNMRQVEIFDVAGRKLFDLNEEKMDAMKVNSNRLGKGLFIYQITFDDHSLQSGKIVVQ